MTRDEFHASVQDLLDGTIAPGDLRALEAELLSDPAARDLYASHAQLHSALETRFQSKHAIEEMGVVPVERIVRQQRRRVVKVSLLSAAAALAVSAIILWRVMAPNPPATVLSFQVTPGAAFTLVHAGGGAELEGNALAEGSRLVIEEGTVECEFGTGVRAVVRAPGEILVLQEDRLRLVRGAGWFRVPDEAAGFTVETSDLEVRDLGTEFGVRALPTEPVEVHVFDGSVEVTSRLAGGGAQVLKAQEARRLEPDGSLAALPADPGKFATALTQTRQIAVANHSFEADVLLRDGDRRTSRTGTDDYNKELVPQGWTSFDDGHGGARGTQGVLSTAPDSHFSQSLAATPDADANDQTYYSAARDLFQVLGETLQANSTYTLTVEIGDRDLRGAQGNPGNPMMHLGAGKMPGEVRLEPAETRLPAQVDGGWVTWTAVYRTGPSPAGLGKPLRIELTSDQQVGWFDNVRLTVTR